MTNEGYYCVLSVITIEEFLRINVPVLDKITSIVLFPDSNMNNIHVSQVRDIRIQRTVREYCREIIRQWVVTCM